MAVDGNSYQNSKPVAAVYKSSPSTLSDGEQDVLHTDVNHGVLVSVIANSAGSTSQKVAGTAASGAAKSGNPVMVGGQDGTNAVTLLTDSNGGLCPAPGSGAWSITNAAAVNNVATATKAAGTGSTKHACTGVQYSIWQDNTGTVSGAAGFTIAIRDGATGVGTVLWSLTFSFPLATNGASKEGWIAFPTPIIGSAATAMCVEFTSSALAHTGCTINAQGYDTK